MGTARIAGGAAGAGPLRAAVIGCGRIGAAFDVPGSATILTHAGAYSASSRTQLVAVCDVDAAMARACGESWNAAAFTSVEELLDVARPDVVSICTPDATHADVAERVLRAASVRGVLLEKPLALTIPDAERVVQLADERGTVFAVNYSRRWAPGIREVARVLATGRFGAVRSVSGHYANGWIHNGTHWIDLARLLAGEVEAVRALGQKSIVDGTDGPLDVELAFANGARGIALGHAGEGLSFFEMDIVCDTGRIRLSSGAELVEMAELAPSATFAGFFQHRPIASMAGGLGDSMLLAIEDLAGSVMEARRPACTGRDALIALDIAECARSSGGAWRTVRARS